MITYILFNPSTGLASRYSSEPFIVPKNAQEGSVVVECAGPAPSWLAAGPFFRLEEDKLIPNKNWLEEERADVFLSHKELNSEDGIEPDLLWNKMSSTLHLLADKKDVLIEIIDPISKKSVATVRVDKPIKIITDDSSPIAECQFKVLSGNVSTIAILGEYNANSD